MKKYILASMVLLVVTICLIQAYLFYSNESLYIKDFEAVAEDYLKIKDIIFEYYNKDNSSEKLIMDIDKSEFVIIDGNKKIDMNEAERNSLKRICETSYKGQYNFIWVTENYIIFWQDETKMYGVIYTDNFKETEEEIKKWYDGVEFRKIDEGWYELGHFGI